MNRILIICAALVVLSGSCAGYRLRQHQNPFGDYEVTSISVPMFINQSSIPNISQSLTREFTHLLSSYPKLKVYPGEGKKTDAVLIGIIRSESRHAALFETSSTVFVDDQLKSSIGNRQEFYVPRTSTYKVELQIVLIKDPTREEKKIIENPLSKQIVKHPKILINQTFVLSGSFDRVVKETVTNDDEGLTNQTKSKANFERSLNELAKSGALQFKETVLNVF
ncbi:MAG: hypothetical protein Fur0010_23260 [Bdellovibrio sp.]